MATDLPWCVDVGTGAAVILVGGGGAMDRSDNSSLAAEPFQHFTVGDY